MPQFREALTGPKLPSTAAPQHPKTSNSHILQHRRSVEVNSSDKGETAFTVVGYVAR